MSSLSRGQHTFVAGRALLRSPPPSGICFKSIRDRESAPHEPPREAIKIFHARGLSRRAFPRVSPRRAWRAADETRKLGDDFRAWSFVGPVIARASNKGVHACNSCCVREKNQLFSKYYKNTTGWITWIYFWTVGFPRREIFCWFSKNIIRQASRQKSVLLRNFI